MLYVNGSDSRLFMRFHKILPSAQGMAVWEDKAFVLYDTGVCGIYDLLTKEPKPVAQFPLGSYNPGIPTKDYRNHANSCMFGGIHYENNPIPLLYGNIGTGTGYDEDGYFYRCAVENIVKGSDGQYTAQTLQVISYHPQGIEDTPYESPCWGCPAWLVDTESGLMYIFSARYRTKRGCVPEGKSNRFLITAFRMPELSDGAKIRLTPDHIVDQFGVDANLQFTQGGTISGGKLYFTFGCPKREYPLSVAVFDLRKKEMTSVIGDLDEALFEEEIECCAPYNGMLLCNTCDGGIYEIKEDNHWY